MVSQSESAPLLIDALNRAKDNAPFLAVAIEKRPDLVALLEAGRLDIALEQCIGQGDYTAPMGEQLRYDKLSLALVLAIGDLAGLLSVEEVTRRLSDFADYALDQSLDAIFAERYPDQDQCGFAVIALGKHGGRELNYSSDIDPIFIYDPQTIPTLGKEDPADAAQRISRRLIDMVGARDAHGYVFRVDMRLRPASEVSPLAIPVNAAISHYESQALTWEQAAFIRARAAAGDRKLGSYFMESLRPFVWRRSLDFGTIDAIASLTRKIRDHYSEGLLLGPGYDLKRGRGGIREVEFFTQAQQLIYGGRDPDLRASATVEALGALGAAGIVPDDVVQMLSAHYRLLRTIEHRLQMVNDQQTHSLPDQIEALDRVARLHGLADGAALVTLLQPVVRQVADIYDELVAAQSPHIEETGFGEIIIAELSDDPALLRDQLRTLGHDAPEEMAKRIAKWRAGQARALRSAAGQKAFEAVLPALVSSLADAPHPDRAMNRLDDLIHSLPSTLNFFRLLEARPGLLQLLTDILSHAQPLADALAQRSDLLDRLIDASAFDMVGDVGQLVAELSEQEAGDDYQNHLDRTRVRVGEMRFALGTQLVEGRQDPLAVASGYARVAEAAIRRLTRCTIDEFVQAHGTIAGSELVILALGRLGGQALTHASDLDLIFLFTGEFGGESDGPRPLGATRYYNRLAQRVIAALSVPTAAGALYEIDTRLRPSGAQGMLAVSTTSFLKYQRETAWTWEHMALCRARPVFGSEAACAALTDDIVGLLSQSRDSDTLRTEALNMRRDMAGHKPPAGPMDAKLLPGGLVDLEFLIHVLQLSHGKGLKPGLHDALTGLEQAGLVDAGLLRAHDLLTRLLVMIRLVAPDCAIPPVASRALVARACGCSDWDALLGAFDDARNQVKRAWTDVFGESRDTLEKEKS